jgi:two-component system, NtrC family, sensor histidine kinase HydH
LDSPPERQARRLRDIVGETDRISRMVSDLLSVARPRQSAAVAVPVGEAVQRVLSLLSVSAQRKQLQLSAELPEELAPALADLDGLQQVLLNLVLNAVQALPPGGRVLVRARTLSQSGERLVAIEVHDDGPGVPEELRERIFDPFFTTRADGTGLGLAVCSHVVGRHGGDIGVSQSELGGACFTVHLRAAEQA